MRHWPCEWCGVRAPLVPREDRHGPPSYLLETLVTCPRGHVHHTCLACLQSAGVWRLPMRTTVRRVRSRGWRSCETELQFVMRRCPVGASDAERALVVLGHRSDGHFGPVEPRPRVAPRCPAALSEADRVVLVLQSRK